MNKKSENIKIILLSVLAIIILFFTTIIVAVCNVFISHTTVKTFKTDFILNRGQISSRVGNTNQATKDYTYLINHNVNKALAYKELGDIEMKSGSYKNAVNYYNKALAENPHYTYLYNARANAKFLSGDSQGASEDYLKFFKETNKAKNIIVNYDTKNDIDFNPYMKNLQKKIKQNWNPPKANRSKRVVVLFKLDKSGNLKKLKIFKTSGVKSADDAAIAAISRSIPFEPLPSRYHGKTVDIQFTFDYNVLNKIKSY